MQSNHHYYPFSLDPCVVRDATLEHTLVGAGAVPGATLTLANFTGAHLRVLLLHKLQGLRLKRAKRLS
jgi:hypothetical protein